MPVPKPTGKKKAPAARANTVIALRRAESSLIKMSGELILADFVADVGECWSAVLPMVFVHPDRTIVVREFELHFDGEIWRYEGRLRPNPEKKMTGRFSSLRGDDYTYHATISAESFKGEHGVVLWGTWSGGPESQLSLMIRLWPSEDELSL